MSNLLFFSCLSALLYRLGGWGHGFNTKVRDLGTPFCMIGYMILSGCWNGWLILCFLLMFGAQTTYWKKKGSDAKWFNWLFTGLAYSLAMLPYSLATGNISGFLIRGVVVTLFTVVWSEVIGKAWIEESGRGGVQILTLPFL